MDFDVGVRIGDFEIEGQVGAGGMGIVYRARQLSLDRVVALKILGPALDSEEGKARFRREAQAVAKLSHPGIATIYFIGQDQQICFFAMEFINGVSLRQVMDRLIAQKNPGLTMESVVRELMPSIRVGAFAVERFDEPTEAYASLPEFEAPKANCEPREGLVIPVVRSATYIVRCCEIARDVAKALSHAHERAVVHRDIKPENLLLDGAGKVHVVDFGLARFYEDMTLTNTGSLVGTPMYMSPEQVSGRLEIDHRTDVYSLGLVLYEMLTLRRPIEAATREGVLRQVMTKSRPPLSWRNATVSQNLESVVHKAIAHDPDERYHSAATLAADLQNVIDRKPVIAPRYRYKTDFREIAAERPRAVTMASILMMSLCLCFSLFLTVGIGTALRIMPLGSEIALMAAFLLALFAASGYLHMGYAWAREVMSFYLLLSLIFYCLVFWRSLLGQLFGSFMCASLIVLVACILRILWRRETEDWLRLARRVRAEQRQRRSAGRE
jgi:serine/threonine protein kinase